MRFIFLIVFLLISCISYAGGKNSGIIYFFDDTELNYEFTMCDTDNEVDPMIRGKYNEVYYEMKFSELKTIECSSPCKGYSKDSDSMIVTNNSGEVFNLKNVHVGRSCRGGYGGFNVSVMNPINKKLQGIHLDMRKIKKIVFDR